MPGNPYEPIFWNVQAASNLAAGCLLTAYPQSGSANPKPIAHGLYRFGVLLALDAATRSLFPALPLASPYEQAIAQQIAAQK